MRTRTAAFRETRERQWPPTLSKTVAASVLGLATSWPNAVDVSYPEIHIDPHFATDGRYFTGTSETSATVRAPKADLDAINEAFVLRNASELRSFISDKPGLVSLILEAFAVAQEYFSDTAMLLDLLEDSESDRIGVELSVQTTTGLEEAQATLEAFDQAWWLANMTRAGSLLTVTLEYL
jgi:hypothetical protein